MGITCCVKAHEALSTSDCILLWQTIIIGIGILVSAGMGIWIVKTLQNRLTNQRVLKDHLIQEIKDLRDEYRDFFKAIYNDTTIGGHIIPWFQLMYIKTADVLDIVNKEYKVSNSILSPYTKDLRDLITDNVDFTSQFKSKSPIVFTGESKNTFLIFQQKHNHLFNDIITSINKA